MGEDQLRPAARARLVVPSPALCDIPATVPRGAKRDTWHARPDFGASAVYAEPGRVTRLSGFLVRQMPISLQ